MTIARLIEGRGSEIVGCDTSTSVGDAVKLLAETLEEEKQTDVKLTDLAVGNINKKAEK